VVGRMRILDMRYSFNDFRLSASLSRGRDQPIHQ